MTRPRSGSRQRPPPLRAAAPLPQQLLVTGDPNGPTEAINLLIKKVKRVGHGLRNFDNYPLRLLRHCDVEWHTPDATRLGRHRREGSACANGDQLIVVAGSVARTL